MSSKDAQGRPRIERDGNPIGDAMRDIRKKRRMKTSEVARDMGLPVRTYEHLEAGTGRITYDRIDDFARVTNSDAIAILATKIVGSSDFALRCADNKLMQIMMIAIMELDDDLGNDIALLEAGVVIGGFTRLMKDFAIHVRKRDTFAEEWLKNGSARLAPNSAKLRPAKA